METLSREAGEMSPAVGVWGPLLGVDDPRGLSAAAAEGGKLKEAALRGDRSVPEPSEVERDGTWLGLNLVADSGCAFQRYADDDFAGDLGRIKPMGRGGNWLLVIKPRP